MKKYMPFVIPVAFAGIAVCVFIGGEVVKELWNWLVPPLFGLPLLSFWQALALLTLCRILFGGFGMRGYHRSSYRGSMAERLADRFAERWQNMTPEERERFRQRVRERCGFDPAAGETKFQ